MATITEIINETLFDVNWVSSTANIAGTHKKYKVVVPAENKGNITQYVSGAITQINADATRNVSITVLDDLNALVVVDFDLTTAIPDATLVA
jgi:hypothetical protein